MSIEDKIKSEININGYVTIDRFMDAALFDKDAGYYVKKNPIGKENDFITAPEISVLFGEILGAFIASQISNNLKNYDHINLIELGSGRGTLLNDILNLLLKFPEIYHKISIYILDINEQLVEIQKITLINHINKIKWIDALESIDSLSPHIYLANEFFDALPVKQFVSQSGYLLERVIKLDQKNNLVLDSIKSTIPEMIALDEDDFEEGDIIEYSPLSISFMQEISKNISKQKGFALIIDYGHINIVSGDTLQSLKNHKYNDLLNNIGDADITYHVNFRMLYNVALNCGLKNLQINTQSEFLKSMGIIDRAKILSKKMNEKEKIDLFSRVNRLINNKEMGELFKILTIEGF